MLIVLGKGLDLGGSEKRETGGESSRALTTSASQEVKPHGSPVVAPTTGAASILPHRAHLKIDFLTDNLINEGKTYDHPSSDLLHSIARSRILEPRSGFIHPSFHLFGGGGCKMMKEGSVG